jgi:dinuclear metal center YbgI/SA1388 family protein
VATQIQHISTFINQWAPPNIKMDYDNVGLLVGNPYAEVKSILTCLDVTEDVVEEAVAKNVQLIVAHHPLIFNKIGSINPTNEQGKIIYQLIKNDIGLLVAHTNLDAALDGVSFVLANILGLDHLRFLDKSYDISHKIRLVTSHDKPEAVLKLLNYYSAEEAHYFSVENREHDLTCFEAIIDEHHLSGLRAEGVGQSEFLHLVSKALNAPAVRFSGSTDRIKKVAICGGSGIGLKKKAIQAGAQAFITADIKYHDFFTEHKNFLLVDVGHYESEFPIVEELRNELADAFENLNVMATTITTNPMNIYISDSEHQSIHQS